MMTIEAPSAQITPLLRRHDVSSLDRFSAAA
jgi:hypothetical protein